jgi:hypothetical protein
MALEAQARKKDTLDVPLYYTYLPIYYTYTYCLLLN